MERKFINQSFLVAKDHRHTIQFRNGTENGMALPLLAIKVCLPGAVVYVVFGLKGLADQP
jgi:hypothetical protein